METTNEDLKKSIKRLQRIMGLCALLTVCAVIGLFVITGNQAQTYRALRVVGTLAAMCGKEGIEESVLQDKGSQEKIDLLKELHDSVAEKSKKKPLVVK